MSSPRASRAYDFPGPSSSNFYKQPRRSSSSIRRSRAESISSTHPPYDPDTYTEDLIPQDVIFDGPSASSVPSSISNFAHRGSRASLADEIEWPKFFATEFDSDAEDVLTEVDIEEEDLHSLVSSRISEASSVAVQSTPDVERGDQFPLIGRKSTDVRSEGSVGGRASKATQRIYLADEDMIVVMSGFRTRKPRLWIYRLLCVISFGMVYLILRWLPRWRLKFMAERLPLSEAHWVVVEVRFLSIIAKCRINTPSYRRIEFDRLPMGFHCQVVSLHLRPRKLKTIPSLKIFGIWITDMYDSSFTLSERSSNS